MRKLTNEVKVNKCIHRISSYREEETLLFSVLSSYGPESVRPPVVLRFTMSHSPSGRFPGGRRIGIGEHETRRQSAWTTAREMTVDKEETKKR